MPTKLNQIDRQKLLQIARETIQAVAHQQKLPALDLSQFSEDLQAEGASFVTLTVGGNLRGCIGTLQAYQPLVKDVNQEPCKPSQDGSTP